MIKFRGRHDGGVQTTVFVATEGRPLVLAFAGISPTNDTTYFFTLDTVDPELTIEPPATRKVIDLTDRTTDAA